MNLTINVISRGRPELLRETIAKTLPNITRTDTTLMVSLDDDDPASLEAMRTLGVGDAKHPALGVHVGPREDSRGEKYDRALKMAPADVYLPAVDHSPIVTPGFDERIVEAASIWPDGIGVVYTRMCDELVPLLQAPTARYVELMGYIYSHDYPYWFIDHEMADIAWMIGRINFADVWLDPRKRPNQTIRMRDVEFWCDFYDRTEILRRVKAREIIAVLDIPEWQKKQQSTWWQLLKNRSEARHNRVRGGAKALMENRGEDGPADEGYLRIKAKAEKRLSDLNTALRAAA